MSDRFWDEVAPLQAAGRLEEGTMFGFRCVRAGQAFVAAGMPPQKMMLVMNRAGSPGIKPEQMGAELNDLVDRGSKLAFKIAMEVARLGPRGERLLPMSQSLEDLTTGFRKAVDALPFSRQAFGGSTFDDFSRHPGQYIPITSGPNKGKKSSAAGRYQFLESTWNDLANRHGLEDFGRENQDLGALMLARENMKRKGLDLDDETWTVWANEPDFDTVLAIWLLLVASASAHGQVTTSTDSVTSKARSGT